MNRDGIIGMGDNQNMNVQNVGLLFYLLSNDIGSISQSLDMFIPLIWSYLGSLDKDQKYEILRLYDYNVYLIQKSVVTQMRKQKLSLNPVPDGVAQEQERKFLQLRERLVRLYGNEAVEKLNIMHEDLEAMKQAPLYCENDYIESLLFMDI